MANFIGITRESCTRGLSSLKKDGIIEISGSSIEIPDINKLHQLSELG